MSNESLIKKIANALRSENKETTIVSPANINTTNFDFYVDNSRSAIINDSRKMYEEDPRIKNGLWRIASDMVSGSFSVSVKSGPYKKKAQEIANNALERLELRTKDGQAGSALISYLVYAMRDGDVFLQIGAAEDEINKLVKMPLMSNDLTSYSAYSKNAYPVMHRNSNAIDEFDNPKKAYFLSTIPLPENVLNPVNETFQWYKDWQILHIRWQHEAPKRYGYPLLGASRITYKMLREGETDVAIRRKTRAGQKRHHKIANATDATIEDYKKWNADSLGDPTAAASDFFSNSDTEIKVLQGDEQIGVIDDIIHHLETLGVGLLVPLSMIGYGKNINRDVLDVQDQEYRRLLQVLGHFPVNSIIVPIIELEWLLHGILPSNYDWSVEWSSKQQWTLNADGLFKLHGLVSPEYWSVMASKVLPSFDSDKELSYIKEKYDQNQMNANKKMDTKKVSGANQNEPSKSSVT